MMLLVAGCGNKAAEPAQQPTDVQTQQDVQAKIDEILEVYATYAEATDYAACEGDRVVVIGTDKDIEKLAKFM